MPAATAIWWVRRDLRLADNPALAAAARAGSVLPVFVLDDALWGPAGPARRAFLAAALRALDEACDGALVVRRGRPATVLAALAGEVGAGGVWAAGDYAPYGRARDEEVERALADTGAPLHRVGSPYAVNPGVVRKADGSPFRVFTPFSKGWEAHGWEAPTPPPAAGCFRTGVDSEAVPEADPPDGVDLPPADEEAALGRWGAFLDRAAGEYHERRNDPGREGTSRMSAYLRWGLVHPRTLLADLDARHRGHRVFRSELAWREFYADVLWHHPASARSALVANLAGIELDEGRAADGRFAAWAEGRTGYPIVDAGMRQLRAEAWMHNRVRMIVASFLVKDLHLDWTRGARWFMAHLVDGDLASNSHGWQWVAGTGTDAAPYFRVFNPVSQGQKFDPDGSYVRRWVPELASLPDRYVHCPWEAPTLPLDAGGYPDRIVDHATEREVALARYQAARA